MKTGKKILLYLFTFNFVILCCIDGFTNPEIWHLIAYTMFAICTFVSLFWLAKDSEVIKYLTGEK